MPVSLTFCFQSFPCLNIQMAAFPILISFHSPLFSRFQGFNLPEQGGLIIFQLCQVAKVNSELLQTLSVRMSLPTQSTTCIPLALPQDKVRREIFWGVKKPGGGCGWVPGWFGNFGVNAPCSQCVSCVFHCILLGQEKMEESMYSQNCPKLLIIGLQGSSPYLQIISHPAII